MKINFTVRFKNPVFWFSIILAILSPVLTYFGMEAKDLTTWKAVADLFMQTIQNPYLLVLIGVGIYNTTIDPTTSGISDSSRALTYTKPAPNANKTQEMEKTEND